MIDQLVCSSSQVLNLKVLCSRHYDGCQWVGELRHVVPHEREECEWAVVGCSYQCGAHLPRRLMDEHEHDMCPQRPVDTEVLKKIKEQHKREIKKMDTRLAAMETRLSSLETKLTAERECYEREIAGLNSTVAEQKVSTLASY